MRVGSIIRSVRWLAIATLAGCQAYDRGVYSAALDGAANPIDTVTHDASMDVSQNDVPLLDVGPDMVAFKDATGVTDANEVTDDVPLPMDVPSMVDVLSPTSCTGVHAGALFCSGFESTTLTGWDGYYAGSGVASLTTAMAYRGVGALRSEITASGGAAAVAWNHLGGLVSGDLYIRGYYFIPSGPVIDQIANIALLPTAASQNVSMLINGDTVAAYSLPGAHYVAGIPSVTLPRDRWVCLEMHLLLSPTAGAIDLFIDGVAAGSGSGFATTPADGQQSVAIGMTYSSPMQVPMVLYVDEVVVDTSPIGCD